MEFISVEVDEEFAKVLESIEQPYLDRPALIKSLLFSGSKQYRIELPIKKIFRWGSKHVEGYGNSRCLPKKDEQDSARERR